MAPSAVAEATRLTDRGPHVPGREHPGHVCPGQQRRTLRRPADRRPAGRYRSRQEAREPGKFPAAAVIHISTVPLIHTYVWG